MKPKRVSAKCVYQGEDVPDELVAETLQFGDAIMASIEGVCLAREQAGDDLNMRAIVGSLVSVLAHYIAGIGDDETRQRAYASTGHELAEMIVTNLELGTHARAISKEDFVQ